jgi:hypothetical protein
MPGEWLAVAIGVGSVGALVIAAALVCDILDTTKGSRDKARFRRKAA